MALDSQRIRADFPILQRTFNDHPLVYLDSAATSQKPRQVIDAESEFYTDHNANVHRGVYALSEEATDAFEASREEVARFLGAAEAAEVVFTRGTTEGINLLAGSLSRGFLEKDDRVLTTVMEHHSNIVPWQLLGSASGVKLDFVDIDSSGRLKLEEYDRLLTRRTKLVTLTHVSNVLGTVNPVREIADRAHDVGALVLVDAAQSAPHRQIDVGALGADFLVFSGHKTLGPTGIGALWGRRALLEKLPPWMGGGEMIREVHRDRVSFKDPPGRFEAGTPNIAGAIGLSSALEYLERVGWPDLAHHEASLVERAYSRAEEQFGDRLRFYGPGPGEGREAVLSFALAGVHPHDVASLLDSDGIAIRSGHHCAQPLMERLGVPALSRASPYLYNTLEEIDRWIESLARVDHLFSKSRAPATSTAN